MRAELKAALEAAEAAGELLRCRFQEGVRVSYKGARDPVTEADREAERLVAERLGERFPGYGFLGEEQGRRRDGALRWVVDPLDGTTNFSRGIDRFCVSIALERDGEVLLAVIRDPLRRESFFAVRGEGAFCNGRRIRVSTTRSLERAVAASGFPYPDRAHEADNFGLWRTMVQACQAVRCLGASALDLAHVACGRLDLFWELGLDPWDQAAGALLVQEAGGLVSAVDGGRFDPHRPSILAANPALHRAAVERLSGAARPGG